uniref:Uncharacterized protein n=1 Tax=Trichuris muris TaxID=70415 RepID=A0A5S6QE67_TRIMR
MTGGRPACKTQTERACYVQLTENDRSSRCRLCLEGVPLATEIPYGASACNGHVHVANARPNYAVIGNYPSRTMLGSIPRGVRAELLTYGWRPPVFLHRRGTGSAAVAQNVYAPLQRAIIDQYQRANTHVGGFQAHGVDNRRRCACRCLHGSDGSGPFQPVPQPMLASMPPSTAAPVFRQAHVPMFAPTDLPMLAPDGPPVLAPVDPPVLAPVGPPVFVPVGPPVLAPAGPPVLASGPMIAQAPMFTIPGLDIIAHPAVNHMGDTDGPMDPNDISLFQNGLVNYVDDEICSAVEKCQCQNK